MLFAIPLYHRDILIEAYNITKKVKGISFPQLQLGINLFKSFRLATISLLKLSNSFFFQNINSCNCLIR